MIIKLDRSDVCKVLLALTVVSYTKGTSPEYKRVHDDIMEQLRKYDVEKIKKEMQTQLDKGVK